MTTLTQEQVMQDWGTDNSDTLLVSVRCITYNHEPYIADALDGFLMQKTNFPFEVIVHDDASTDRTADIIREYETKFPKIIKPIYETENLYSKHDGSLGRMVNAACTGKYIAYCEGDDYWIDENKLQMQVEFLEDNPEYGMCYTKSKQYVQEKQKFLKNSFGEYVKDFEDLLVNGNRIPTLSVVIQKSIMQKYKDEIHPENKGWLMGDYPLWLYATHEKKSKFFDEATCVYRILPESAAHTKNIEKRILFLESTRCIKEFYTSYFNSDITYIGPEKFFEFYLKSFLLNDYLPSARLEFRNLKCKNLKLRFIGIFLSNKYLFKFLAFIKGR